MTLILHTDTKIHTDSNGNGNAIHFRTGGWFTLPDGSNVSPASDGWTNGEWSLSTLISADTIPEGKVSSGTTVALVKGLPKSVHTLTDRYASEADRVDAWRSSARCSRLQGRLALGESEMARFYTFIDGLSNSWTLLQIVNNSGTWQRDSEDMMLLGFALDYKAEQMDALFVSAMHLEV